MQHAKKRPHFTPGSGHHVQRRHDAGFLLAFFHLAHIAQVVARQLGDASLGHSIMQAHLQTQWAKGAAHSRCTERFHANAHYILYKNDVRHIFRSASKKLLKSNKHILL